MQVKKGNSVRIECSASGNPSPNVTWTRKNNVLPNGEWGNFMGLNWKCNVINFYDFRAGDERLYSPILTVESMDRHKGGVYICTANNGVGKPASSQVVLHVLCELKLKLLFEIILRLKEKKF